MKQYFADFERTREHDLTAGSSLVTAIVFFPLLLLELLTALFNPIFIWVFWPFYMLFFWPATAIYQFTMMLPSLNWLANPIYWIPR